MIRYITSIHLANVTDDWVGVAGQVRPVHLLGKPVRLGCEHTASSDTAGFERLSEAADAGENAARPRLPDPGGGDQIVGKLGSGERRRDTDL